MILGDWLKASKNEERKMSDYDVGYGKPPKHAQSTAISAPAQIVNGDASMGQQLAQKWCSDCHAVGAEDAEAYGSVPSFVLIAEMCFNIGGLNWRGLA
jgi:hypothetical protein